MSLEADRAMELLDEITFDSASRPPIRPGVPNPVLVRREIEESDIAFLANSVQTKPQLITRVRNTHHKLAKLLATGESNASASLLTGYSPSYISEIQRDPTFRELLAYYCTQDEVRVADVRERMTAVGLSALDEMQQRLEEDPSKWSNGQLMELTELTLVKTGRVGGSGGGFGAAPTGGAGVSVNVSFVSPGGGNAGQATAPVIDVENKE